MFSKSQIKYLQIIAIVSCFALSNVYQNIDKWPVLIAASFVTLFFQKYCKIFFASFPL